MNTPNSDLPFVIVSRDDIYSSSTWSGIPASMAKALEAAGAHPIAVDQLGYPTSTNTKIANKLVGMTGDNPYFTMASARHYARVLKKKLAKVTPARAVLFLDAIVPGAAVEPTGTPHLYFSDAVYSQLIEQGYPGYSDLTPRTHSRIKKLETDLFKRMDGIVFSSQWAASECTKKFHILPSKIHVCPFGANLGITPQRAVTDRRAKRPIETCELLFVGVHWERKGGPIAVQVVNEMNRRGIPARLTIVGCEPPASEAANPHLRVIPFIDKSTERGVREFHNLFASSTFFLLPTHADCSPVVFSEAYAYGLPVIARDVAAVSEIIDHGETGFLMGEHASISDYVDSIAELIAKPESYARACYSARERYEETFNWSTWAESLLSFADTLVANPKDARQAADGDYAGVPAASQTTAH